MERVKPDHNDQGCDTTEQHKPPQSKDVNQEACTICLCPVTERAVAFPCNHLTFDFVCLVQWLQTSTACPLCKVAITEVQYDFRSTDNFKRYVVPRALIQPSIVVEPRQPEQRHAPEQCHGAVSQANEARKRVYENQLFSQHVGSSPHSGYKDFSAQDFATSQALQSRARTFLRRELQAIDAVSALGASSSTRPARGHKMRARTSQASIDYLNEYIIAVLRSHDLLAFDGRAEELVTEFMPADTALLLLHELNARLRSPYERLGDWDEAVQYSQQLEYN